MRKEIAHCDSCKKEIKDEIYTFEKYGSGGRPIMGDNRTPFDLCHECFDALCWKLKIKPLEEFPNLLDNQ